jgi:hypothetical protein
MLATSIIIGIVCYLLCCLNQIKNKCIEMHKRHKVKKARRKHLKRLVKKERKRKKLIMKAAAGEPHLATDRFMDANNPYESDTNDEEDDENDDMSGLPPSNRTVSSSFNSTFEKNSNVSWKTQLGGGGSVSRTTTQLLGSTPQPSAPPCPTPGNSGRPPRAADKTQLTLNLANNNTASPLNNHRLVFDEIKEEEDDIVDENENNDEEEEDEIDDPGEDNYDDVSAPNSPMIGRVLDGIKKKSSPIEPIEVRELNESPKSVYSRLQTLTRMARQKQIEKQMKPVDMGDAGNQNLSSDEKKAASCFSDQPRDGGSDCDYQSSGLSTNVDPAEGNENGSNHSDNDYDDDNESDDDSYAPAVEMDLNQVESQPLASPPRPASLFRPPQTFKSHDAVPSPATRHNFLSINGKPIPKPVVAKIQSHQTSRNKQHISLATAASDLDLDDNLIFNEDDNDSLSSAGGVPEQLLAGGGDSKSGKASLNSSRNNSVNNFRLKKKERSTDRLAQQQQQLLVRNVDETRGAMIVRSNGEDDEREAGSPLHVPLASGGGVGLDLSGIRGIHDGSSSGGGGGLDEDNEQRNAQFMSDIEPDENLFSNILVKTQSSQSSSNRAASGKERRLVATASSSSASAAFNHAATTSDSAIGKSVNKSGGFRQSFF